MRRYDLLEEYQTLLSPQLAPQARPSREPVWRLQPWPLPLAVLALGVLLTVP